jgi:hypothetical protein
LNKKLTTTLTLLLAFGWISAASAATMVTAPPDAPSWWNKMNGAYAYGYWEDPAVASPPNDATHFASGYLHSGNFVITKEGLGYSIFLNNNYSDLNYKDIYIRVETAGTIITIPGDPPNYILGITPEGKKSPAMVTYSIEYLTLANGKNGFIFTGRVTPQPSFFVFDFTANGALTKVWAGEQCLPVPEPSAGLLLGMGLVGLGLRRRRTGD